MSEPIITKRCSKCKQVKPTSDFYRNRSRKDGLCHECRQCKKLYEHSINGKRRRRKYEQSTNGKATHHKYGTSHKGRVVYQRWAHIHRARYPHRERARMTVSLAVKRGTLPRTRDCICTLCGKQAQQYHHYMGYAPDHWLDVIPLCRQCHITLHKHQGSVPSL